MNNILIIITIMLAISYTLWFVVNKISLKYFNVKEIVVNTKKASGTKCPVCWKIDTKPCRRHST